MFGLIVSLLLPLLLLVALGGAQETSLPPPPPSPSPSPSPSPLDPLRAGVVNNEACSIHSSPESPFAFNFTFGWMEATAATMAVTPMGNKTLFLAPCHGHAASFYDEGFTGVCHKGEAACVCHPDTFSETNSTRPCYDTGWLATREWAVISPILFAVDYRAKGCPTDKDKALHTTLVARCNFPEGNPSAAADEAVIVTIAADDPDAWLCADEGRDDICSVCVKMTSRRFCPNLPQVKEEEPRRAHRHDEHDFVVSDATWRGAEGISGSSYGFGNDSEAMERGFSRDIVHPIAQLLHPSEELQVIYLVFFSFIVFIAAIALVVRRSFVFRRRVHLGDTPPHDSESDTERRSFTV